MKPVKIIFIICFMLLLCIGFAAPGALAEEEGQEFSIELMPFKYVNVKGDVNKFRAQNWMDDDYSGGIKSLLFRKYIKEDTLLEFEGRSIPDENDNMGKLLLKKEGVADVRLDYASFRKYYDNSGGYYYPFTTLQNINLSKELEMDIDHMEFAISPYMGDNGGITLLYERHTKNGSKSRLTWTEAREGGTRRETVPSYQDIDEEVNIIALQGETTIAGVNLNAEQRYETVDSHNIRYEQWKSTASTAAQNKKRTQFQSPEATSFTTTLAGNKWFDNDTAYAGLAYRFNKLSNSELENIIEASAAGVPTNYSHAEQIRNATAENDIDDHVLVGNYMKQLSPQLKLTAKFKNQIMYRLGESTYPQDDGTLDGVADSVDYSVSENKALNFGQDVGLQYTGIKNTSLYGNVEVAEIRNDIKERQLTTVYALNWERFTKTKILKTGYTLGSRVVPNRYFNFTTQYRWRYENNDYDDKTDTSSSINSAFVDSMRIFVNELSTKVTWKPLRWLSNSFRYQLDQRRYDTRVEALSDTQEGRTLSHTFTYDIFVQPTDNVLLNFSYSLQNQKTTTPLGSNATLQFPGFSSDYQSLLFSGSYTPDDELNFTGAFGWTFADNFNDFTSTLLPLGSSYGYTTAELGMEWKPKDKNWTIAPHYGYYNYNTPSIAEFGNYTAHVTWVDFSFDW